MKRRIIRVVTVFFAVLLFLFVVQIKPAYWKLFRSDEKEYDTFRFYGLIRQEYVPAGEGKAKKIRTLTGLENGDILVTDGTYCLTYRHGHAAIVIDAKKGLVLESFGLGTVSEYSDLSAWETYPHVAVYRLKETKEIRNQIAEYAKKHLTGISYRLSCGMIDDKDMDGQYWGTQCAHLVWLAYHYFGYDIDGDGGWLVTPHDITESPWLKLISFW